MTIIIVSTPPPRREIVKDGITYREVLPGDDATWWEVIALVFGGILIGVPGVLLLLRFFFFPVMDWIMRL